MISSPLFTISIPTYNRADYLRKNLEQLRSELMGIPVGTVDILVSDNCSEDDTRSVVEAAAAAGVPLMYVRNDKNVGWGPNFFQCFDLAKGKYVLLLGDDDLLVDGALRLIVAELGPANYGIVCIRPYGFDHDFRAESPGAYGRRQMYAEGARFLVAIGALSTMISACIINKHVLSGVDTKRLFCGDLAHLNLVITAALRGGENLFVDRPLVACKRNNSSSYKFSKVFVQEYWQIMDSYRNSGLDDQSIRTIETRMLFSYYPFYLFLERLTTKEDHKTSLVHFSQRFGPRWLYKLWIAPTLILPRPLALAWGAVTTAVGRILGGELRRGLYFAASRCRRKLFA